MVQKKKKKKIKISTTFAWIWGLTGITLHGERALQLPVKCTWDLFCICHACICADYLLFRIYFNLLIAFSAFCSMTDDAIWIIHLFRQSLKWKQKIQE